jgi:hypothetical protein
MSLPKSEHETCNIDVFEGIRNKHNEEFRIESRGKDIVLAVKDSAGKICEFNISYDNRIVLEKIKSMCGAVSIAISKASGNILRAEDK